ncbi:hypothetical protein [Pontibacter rugosus]|uniref:Gylcosyl hydrolase 115 C-terminal domain-containing protein n=1 Tax=Pontibacter rugosus TaxID=1745966 RepID=A0ABW3SKC6_9BACT
MPSLFAFEALQIINIHEVDTIPDWKYQGCWNDAVTNHIRKKQSVHKKPATGKNTLKVWMTNLWLVFKSLLQILEG